MVQPGRTQPTVSPDDYVLDIVSTKIGSKRFAIYAIDNAGNKSLLYRDPNISCLDPIPVRPRPIPNVIPGTTPPTGTPPNAIVTVANVYRNRLIGDLVQYGEIKNLWTTSPIKEFLNKDMKLQSSGIAGPATISKIKPVFITRVN